MTIRDYLAQVQSSGSEVTVYLFGDEEQAYGTIEYLGDKVVIINSLEDDDLPHEVAIRINKIERIKKWL